MLSSDYLIVIHRYISAQQLSFTAGRYGLGSDFMTPAYETHASERKVANYFDISGRYV